MSTANDRRAQVAALRSQTRKYLIEARERRLGLITEPEPEPAPQPEPAPRPAPAYLPDPRIAALSPASPAPPAPPAPQPELTSRAVEPAPAAETLKQLPLGALRLLGQGMIWRLNNLGIQTLDELATCDPKRLGESLGPIGRLVRTEVWVEAAREILKQA